MGRKARVRGGKIEPKRKRGKENEKIYGKKGNESRVDSKID